MATRANAVLDGSALLWVERLQIGCGRRREHELSPRSNATLNDSSWNRNEIAAMPVGDGPGGIEWAYATILFSLSARG
jgi:hypothetical protein